MKVTKYTPIKVVNDAKGKVINTYITFSNTDKKRIRKRVKEEDIDNIKDYWENMLKGGFDPTNIEDEKIYLKLNSDPKIKDTLQEFYLSSIVTGDTLTSYKSKLKLLEDKFGNVEVKEIVNTDIERILKDKIKDGTFAQSTLNHAKKVFTAFFTYCVDEKIISKSPMAIKKTIKSDKDTKESHVPFSEEHFKLIIDELKKEGNELYFNFVNFIYHLHLRPKEINNLKKGDLDLVKNVITIKSSVAKNDKKEILPIFPALRKIIDTMKLDSLDKDDYIFFKQYSDGRKTQLSKSYISDRFRPMLKNLGLYDDTGYDLYSFKAKGNLDKLDKMGWSLVQLQKCNRHATVNQTLTYLKNIGKVTDIDNLDSIEL